MSDEYRITNTGQTTKTYRNSRGDRITIEPGETVVRRSRPPRDEELNGGWDVENIGSDHSDATDDSDAAQTSEDDSEGGE